MRRIFAALAALFWASPLWAEGGRTGAAILRKPMSARAEALGEAFTAVTGGVSSLGYNPAGLAPLARPEVLATYASGVADDFFSFLGYAHPLPAKWGTPFLGLSYLSGGRVEITLTGGMTETRAAARDWALAGGWAVPIAGGLSVGATGKMYRLELVEEVRATGAAVDAGAHWQTPLKGLSLGLSVLNMGPGVVYEQEADPLPRTERVGVAYSLSLGPDHGEWWEKPFTDFLFTVDAFRVREQEARMSVGAEARIGPSRKRSMALRAGWLGNSDQRSASIGLGFRQGGHFFDYTLGLMKVVEVVHHVSIGYQF